MNFGAAITALKAGKLVARTGWNGKGMYIFLEPWNLVFLMGEPIPYQPCIIMKTADNKLQPGWLASQADMLAEDWEEVDPPTAPFSVAC